MVTITHQGIEELTAAIAELEALTSKPTLSGRDEKRHSFLLAKVALLKQGISVAELRHYEQDRLLAESGLRAPQRARTRLPEEVESEWRSFVQRRAVRMTSRPPEHEVRANEAGQQTISYTPDVPGGAFVPQGMHDRAFETMKKYDAVFDPMFSNAVETNTGNAMAFPSWDDVSNASVQVGETTQSTQADVANFGSVMLNAYAFGSKIVAVSIELLQDSNFPWGAVLERVFAMRHARGVGAAFVNASGVSAPTGLITAVLASGASPVIASGSASNDGGSETGATTIGTQDLNTLFGKLDPAYRVGAAWYMNDSTLTYLQGLLDKQGRPIVKFRDGLSDVPYILGKPVAVCPSMPAMASGKNSVLFGNPMYFVIRRVPSSMYVRAFWENPTLVQYGLVGFESWLRADSNLVAPNANYLPFQFIQQHS